MSAKEAVRDGETMGELVIVAREAQRLHEYLVRTYAGTPDVSVIIDRRRRARRRTHRAPDAERRQGDRRARLEVDEHIDRFGWAIVRL
ncbi:MAG TPA: hypothetical protein VGL09_09430 [Methylomirabilota bacterium]